MALGCRLGRRILRPLLRSEVGEVANRRAWFDVTKLTPEVLQLYKQPLRVQGWDLALLEVSSAPMHHLSHNLIPCWTSAAHAWPRSGGLVGVQLEYILLVPFQCACCLATNRYGVCILSHDMHTATCTAICTTGHVPQVSITSLSETVCP